MKKRSNKRNAPAGDLSAHRPLRKLIPSSAELESEEQLESAGTDSESNGDGVENRDIPCSPVAEQRIPLMARTHHKRIRVAWQQPISLCNDQNVQAKGLSTMGQFAEAVLSFLQRRDTAGVSNFPLSTFAHAVDGYTAVCVRL